MRVARIAGPILGPPQKKGGIQLSSMFDKPDIWLIVMSWLRRHISDVLCRDVLVLDRLLARDLRRGRRQTLIAERGADLLLANTWRPRYLANKRTVTGQLSSIP